MRCACQSEEPSYGEEDVSDQVMQVHREDYAATIQSYSMSHLLYQIHHKYMYM